MPQVISSPAAPGSPRAGGITLTVGGVAVPVFVSGRLHFASVSADGPCAVAITCEQPFGTVVMRPRHDAVPVQGDLRRLCFTISRPRTVYVDFSDRPALALTIAPPETWSADAADPAVISFGPGLHHAGEIAITAGQTLYLAAGAWVHGWVRCTGAERVAIRGRGVLDGSSQPAHARQLIVFDGCRDVLVEGITAVNTPSWTLVFGGCDRVHARNLALIGWVVTSDGIDVVGSRDVLIEDCFLRTNDDCVAIKAVDYQKRPAGTLSSWESDVARVMVRRCLCYNDQAGNVLEIGFETRAASIAEITFEDCDIIGAHGEGGVFTIHNGDRAVIEKVLYRNIRVEHFYDRFIDLRVLHSRYSKDALRGTIRAIRFEDIQAIADQFNTPSLIGGFDAAHPVQDVAFVNLRMGQQHITHPDQLHLFTSHVQGLTFS